MYMQAAKAIRTTQIRLIAQPFRGRLRAVSIPRGALQKAASHTMRAFLEGWGLRWGLVILWGWGLRWSFCRVGV